MPNIIIKNEYGEDELYEGVNTVRFLNEEGNVVSYKYNSGETYPRPAANQHRVRFIDYDGFVLREVYVDSGDAAPSIENPTRDGYVFTGWNQSAETLSSITRNIDVGAMYVAEGVSTEATNGASTFNIRLKGRDSKTVTLYIYSLGSNEFLIDWGDGGTSSMTATSTTYYYKSHTYAAAGEYTITVTRTAGDSEYYFGQYALGAGSNGGVLGNTNNTTLVSAILSTDIKTITGGTFYAYYAVNFVVIPDSVTNTVTQQGVHTIRLVLGLAGQSHACGHADALTQAAGGHIHAGHQIHIGVALQIAVDTAQSLQILHGEEATLSQRCVQTGSGVTLGQHEAVTIALLGIGGVDVQFLKIQISKQIRSGQAAAGVTALGREGGLDNAHTHLAGGQLQLLFLVESHCIAS